MKKSVLVVLFLTFAFLAGPRVPVDTSVEPIAIETATVSTYVQEVESAVEGLRPGTSKEIIWARHTTRGTPVRRKTPISIVYIHGFSATKQEIRPVPDIVARELGANLFYTRLTGHGVPGEELGQVTVHDWIRDVTEAVAVGQAIGNRVILMGTSTGATLAAWAAAQPDLAAGLAGIVLVSPNFGPNDARADMLLWPWGKQILHVVQGDTFRWEPANADHERYWTRSYPTDALLPMMAVVKLAREVGLSSSLVPVFVAWSPDDRVVNPDVTAALVADMDSTRVDTMIVTHALDRNQHVIAGDILSPNTSEQVAARMIEFIRGLPAATPRP